MKTLLIATLCLTFLNSFGQEIQTKEDIEVYKRNHVKQIDIINIVIKDFKETPKDTLFCDKKFNNSGQLIEQKYIFLIGSPQIRHLYYNNQGLIVQEITLKPKDFFHIHDLHKNIADSLYIDTTDIRTYQYKNNRIDFVVRDSWMDKSLIKYKYSNEGYLLATYQTDSADSYIDDFVICKYDNFKDIGIKLSYKVSNSQHMTSYTSYYYKNNGDEDFRTYSFNGFSITSYYNSDGLMTHFKTKKCDNEVTDEGKVTFRQDGLIDYITYYKVDSEKNILIPTAKKIYHYDRY